MRHSSCSLSQQLNSASSKGSSPSLGWFLPGIAALAREMRRQRSRDTAQGQKGTSRAVGERSLHVLSPGIGACRNNSALPALVRASTSLAHGETRGDQGAALLPAAVLRNSIARSSLSTYKASVLGKFITMLLQSTTGFIH